MKTELERARHTCEMWERATEQGLAHERGGDYFWNPGCSAQDVDWDRPMEDETEQEDTTDDN